jgi:hypothetical protein
VSEHHHPQHKIFQNPNFREDIIPRQNAQIQRESRKSQFGWGGKRAGKKMMMMMMQGCLMNSPSPLPSCKFLVEKGFYYKKIQKQNQIRKRKKREFNTQQDHQQHKNFLTYSKNCRRESSQILPRHKSSRRRRRNEEQDLQGTKNKKEN